MDMGSSSKQRRLVCKVCRIQLHIGECHGENQAVKNSFVHVPYNDLSKTDSSFSSQEDLALYELNREHDRSRPGFLEANWVGCAVVLSRLFLIADVKAGLGRSMKRTSCLTYQRRSTAMYLDVHIYNVLKSS